MSESRWSQPLYNREQLQLFSPSLEDMIDLDHKVRRLDCVLKDLDWSNWESAYNLKKGQPPIHPRLIAGCILYGLTERIRSSRELEKASRQRIDFMWFLSGRSIDHSTFSAFRVNFADEIEELFKQLALKALKGKHHIELAVDGTRIRSNSALRGTLDSKTISNKAKEVSACLSDALAEMALQDSLDNPGTSDTESLLKNINRLKQKEIKLKKALEEAQKRDKIKAKNRRKDRSSTSKVPLTDPESYTMKNKEGGYAPNYTPTVAVDTERKVILSADVPIASAEDTAVIPAVEATTEITGNQPDAVLFDSCFATGENLKELDSRGIGSYSSAGKKEDNSFVLRSDLTKAVDRENYIKLPANSKGKLTKDAFIYDKEKDCYYCPMGKSLRLASNSVKKHYMCYECDDCPLIEKCLSRNAKRRTVTVDKYDENRQNLYIRMATEEAEERYKRRATSVEWAFANIKHVMGIRRFLLRGIKKVRTEWTWTCSAHNLSRIIN
ncbi:MAG: IS1182 family transposase [Pseudomonadales bacterium]|nr:IS1182 family transposase [Pseudomonadales bacterium]